jgi:tRNA threonylcarbamoyladenosine biosynthesis protein TsaE
MTRSTHEIPLTSPQATQALAQRIGQELRPGDVILLTGSIGVGKTHFARSLIQSLQDTPEDVPSPTFTLVQVYDTRAGELWHADLYRLGSPDECVELGLSDAFETAICLVEWPDRLEDLTPDTALSITLENAEQPDARLMSLSWTHDRWSTSVKGLQS